MSGTVTSVAATGTPPITVTGSPITTSGTIGISLDPSGVVAGAYPSPLLTVDAFGRITSIATVPPGPFSLVGASTYTATSTYPCTGTADDAQINAAITAAAAAGGGVVLLTQGVFNISQRINAGSNVTLRGSGIGATILLAANYLNDNLISAITVSNFTLESLTVDGNNATQFPVINTSSGASASTTIAMTGTTGITIGLSVYGAGIAGRPQVTAINPGVSVTVTTAQTVGAGVALSFNSNDDAQGSGVFYDGSPFSGMRDVEVRNAATHGIFWLNKHGNSDGYWADRLVIHGNAQIGFHVHSGDAFHTVHNYTVGNVWCFANSTYPGSRIPYISGPRQYGGFYVVYSGTRWGTVSNVFVWNEPGPGLTISGENPPILLADGQVGQQFVLSNIVVNGCGTDGTTNGLNANVLFQKVAGGIVVNGLVSEGANGDGVAFVSSGVSFGEILIEGGIIRNNHGNGVNLSVSSGLSGNVRLARCQIAGNTGSGVLSLFPAADCDVTDCIIAGNGGRGLTLASLARVRIRGNWIGQNATGGIKLTAASDVVVESNILLDNCAVSAGAQRSLDLGAVTRVRVSGNQHVVSTPATTTTKAASSASTFLTVTSTAGIVVGQVVSGTGIAGSPTVVRISAVTGPTVEVSTSQTVASGVTLIFARPNTANSIVLDATCTAVTIDRELFDGPSSIPIRMLGAAATANTRNLVLYNRLNGTAPYMLQCDAGTAFVGTQGNIGNWATAFCNDLSGGATVVQNFTSA